MIDAAHVVVSRSIGSGGSRRRKPNAALQTRLPAIEHGDLRAGHVGRRQRFPANDSALAVVIVGPSSRRMEPD